VVKKHGRQWRRTQRKWRQRDSQIIEKVKLILNHRMERLTVQHCHTSHVKGIDEDTMISAHDGQPFQINRDHQLWDTLPITWFAGKRPPNWENLSEWGKLQLAMFPLEELGCITFTGNLHPDLKRTLVSNGKDARIHIREAFRSALKRETGFSDLEYFFVVEGHTKGIKRSTGLHIHGVIASDRLKPGILGEAQVKRAIAKAVGQWNNGSIGRRAVHTKRYWKPGKAFVSYLLKRVRSRDDLLLSQRLVISRPLTSGTRAFWLAVSGLDGSSQAVLNARVAPKGSMVSRIAKARAVYAKKRRFYQSQRATMCHALKRRRVAPPVQNGPVTPGSP